MLTVADHKLQQKQDNYSNYNTMYSSNESQYMRVTTAQGRCKSFLIAFCLHQACQLERILCNPSSHITNHCTRAWEYLKQEEEIMTVMRRAVFCCI